MKLMRRWRHGPEREQEQLLVRLWTMNSLQVDSNGQLTPPASALVRDASTVLKPSLKYLSGPEIEKTVTEVVYDHQFIHNLRKHINFGRPGH